MTSRTFFLGAALVLIAAPAFAQTALTTTNTGTKSNFSSTLSKSDEDFLSEMPVSKFPGKAQMQDKDHDGIVDSEETGNTTSASGIPDPFAAPGTEEKPKIKYVYTPKSSTTLRRSIQDDRIEDGYVQGYMQQTGPKDQ